MRMLILAVLLGTASFAQQSDEKVAPAAAYRTILEFDVMSTEDAFSRTIGDGLTLRVERERAVGLDHMGWDLSVTVDNDDNRNLLYHSLYLHGPHPSGLEAWHFADFARGEYWGADVPRILPVYGYPLELRAECQRCQVTGEHFQSPPDMVYRNEFTAGVVRIGLRRLTNANPQQIR